jgi:signal transduction histidine kinase
MRSTNDPTMDQRIARWISGAMIAVIAAAIVLDIVFQLLDRNASGQSSGDAFLIPFTIVGATLYAAIGRLIVRRQPSNTVGWLLLAIPTIATLAAANGAYASHTLVVDPGSLPFGVFAAWIDRWSIVVVLAMFIPIFLLFPDGRLPSPRWRWALVATVAAPAVTVIAFAVTPGRLTGAFADLTSVHVVNPTGIRAAASLIDALTGVAGFATFGTAVLAGIAITVRFRRARAEERQQIRWLLVIAIVFFVLLVSGVLLGDRFSAVSDALFTVTFAMLLIGIPAACGVAILRYRLYDLDVVIRRTVVFGLLAAFVTAVYIVVVGGIGALIGSRSNTVLSFAAAAVLAVAFQPARDRARRLTDRLVYGKRATPYEVLAEFSDRMAETYATEDVLPRMAEILRDGTGAVSARVWLRVGTQLRPVATAGNASDTAGIEIRDDAIQPVPGEHVVEVRHQGELLGALSLRMPASEPIDPQKDRLMRDLAGQAGLVLRNARLISELRASRQRLVAAQDEERRKLERNLHDGAQQQLVALAVKLRLAEQLAERDGARTREMLEALGRETQDALENLRTLARGIYPPLLADKGLGPALEAQAGKASLPVEVFAADIRRYPQEIEAAVYFCCLEALQNVQKYANATRAKVRLSHTDDSLSFEVADDGEGFDRATADYGTGLQGMADRLDAVGGTLEVRTAPGRGTTIVGLLPAAAVVSDDAPETEDQRIGVAR